MNTSFQKLDKNGDGFLSRSELQEALAAPGLTARDAASLNFLLVRLGEIGSGDETDKRISREDLNHYFAAILPDQP
ncbi:MAG: hypothetical protein JSS83_18870 [Cyanobacteria bacterium SZAS LIN-3]|nr:hypothetical protein [Cyanobacteria bacterium SZAS LIN-3]MBS2005970.1 hypothetical protein [Cyanobacteria bacterium SZAS TMP-1]